MARYARYFSSTPEYDVAVIGGGPGGYVAAIKAAQLGLKTVCVEGRGSLGGTCLNVGCIPSKALLNATTKLHEAQHSFKDFGLNVGEVTVDWKQMQTSKNNTVKGLTQGIEGLFKKNKVDYVKGWGSFKTATDINVNLVDGGKQELKAKNVIIATGSEPSPLPGNVIPIDEKRVITSTGALSLENIPKSMIVIGGGVIGLEMGSVYSRLGAEVTVVEFQDKILGPMDGELSKKFLQILKKQGFKFELGTKVVGGDVSANSVTVHMEGTDGKKKDSLTADVVLVSTGRRPYTHNLGLENIGIETDKFGRIPINDHLQTSVKNVYAIGDVVAGPMLAHKSEEEGIAAVEIIKGLGGHVNYDAIPGVVYTHPEIASVGKTEEELKEAGTKYNKGFFPMMANSRARTNLDTEGFIKILTDKETDKILGIHIISTNAGEAIAEGVLGMEYGAAAEDIARTCHAHPTLSEAFKEACMDAYDKPIHF